MATNIKTKDEFIAALSGLLVEWIHQLVQGDGPLKAPGAFVPEEIKLSSAPKQLLLRVPSRSRAGMVHDITITSEGLVECTCESYKYRETCYHLERFKVALNFLHPTLTPKDERKGLGLCILCKHFKREKVFRGMGRPSNEMCKHVNSMWCPPRAGCGHSLDLVPFATEVPPAEPQKVEKGPFLVQVFNSRTTRGKKYHVVVTDGNFACNCPGFIFRGECRHVTYCKTSSKMAITV